MPPPHLTLVHLWTLGLEQEKVSLECDLLPSDLPVPSSYQGVETPPVCVICDLRNKAGERWETLSPSRVSGLLYDNHVLEQGTRVLKGCLFLCYGHSLCAVLQRFQGGNSLYITLTDAQLGHGTVSW